MEGLHGIRLEGQLLKWKTREAGKVRRRLHLEKVEKHWSNVMFSSIFLRVVYYLDDLLS